MDLGSGITNYLMRALLVNIRNERKITLAMTTSFFVIVGSARRKFRLLSM